ncbi:MAG: SurA N-terminal domain-containing protein [Candidatus Azobacteroides sp.]|nr:SurA N-terminal domain-containing protein [Candidatus Azobacteroides sp.]
MATLEKIRRRSGLLVGVVGLALLAFILGDFLNPWKTSSRQRAEVVLSVDGENTGILDFQAKVAEMEQVYKMQTGNSSMSEDVSAQIRESVFETMVRDILLGEASLKTGVTVSKDELSDLIMGDNISPMIQQMPMFRNQQTGKFDRNVLLQFLQTIESDDHADNADVQSAKNYWLFVERTIKQQKLEEKLTNLVAKSIVVNSLDAKAAFDANNESVDFDYVAQLYSSIADDQVSVTDQEIEKLYNKRKELFKQQEAMMISYIAVDIVPSQDDFNKVAEILNKVKVKMEDPTAVAADVVNDNSDVPFSDVFVSTSGMEPEIKNFVQNATTGNIEGPLLINTTYHLLKLIDKTTAADSVKINQITLPQMDEKQLTHLTDSLINVLNKGKTFSELSLELTGGKSNGEMGWMTEASLLKASDEKFKSEVFNAPLNKVFVANSTLGSHLVQVTERTAPVAKYKIADVKIDVSPSSETYKNLYNDLTHFVSKNKTLESFKAAAAEAGYTLVTEAPVGKNDQTVGAVKNVRQLIRWLYGQKKGAVSDVFECQDKFVVVAVEGHQQEGFRPLASVSDILKRELLNQKKGEKIVNGLKGKNFESLEQYAEAMSSSIQSVKFVTFATNRITGIGVEPIVTAAAPFQEVGKISKPLAGDNAVYVLKVTDKRESGGEFNMASQQQMLNTNNGYRIRYQLMQVLRDEAKIEDNRIRFY